MITRDGTFWSVPHYRYTSSLMEQIMQSMIKSYREPTTGEPVPKDLVIGESALFLSAGE